ncbi:MAG: hypothetical protein U0414_37070 [Polyangiaceae bacterium]
MRLASVLLVLAVALVACGTKKKPKEDDAPRRAEPSASASESASRERPPGQTVTDAAIVDVDYRFTLKRPTGPGWSVLGEEDASALGIVGTRAGFIGPFGVSGTIGIDEQPSVDLDQQVDEFLRSKGAVQMQIEERSSESLAGATTRRIGVATMEAGVTRRECTVLMLSKGFVYVIGANVVATPTQPRGCGFLEPLLASFSLDEGEITPRLPVVSTADVVGPTYRLRRGTFESAAGAFRLEAGTRTRLVAGDDAKSLYGAADVAVLYASPAAALAFRSDATEIMNPAVALDGYAAQLAQFVGAVPNGRTVTYSFMGRELVMRELDAPSYEWTIGLDYAAGRATLVAGWTPKGTRARASELFRKTLEALTPISTADAATLQAELDASPIDDNLVAGAFSLRHGVYRDFMNGVRWTKPASGWIVQAGVAAAAVDPYAGLIARNRAADIQCSLEVFAQHFDNDAWHTMLRGLLTQATGMTWGKSSKAKIDGRAALRSSGHTAGSAYAYRITTRAEPVYDLALLCYGSERAMADHPEVPDLFEQQFRFDPTSATEQVGQRVVDHQLGFALELPSPWVLRMDGAAARRSITALAADTGSGAPRFIEALAIQSRLHWDATFAVGYSLAAELEYRGLAPTEDEPSYSDTTVAGQSAKRFVFKAKEGEPIECVTFQVGYVRYALVARGAGAYGEAVAGFTLLSE